MADPFTDLIIAAIIDGVVGALEGVITDKIREAFGLAPNVTPATENHPLDIWTDVHDTFLHVTDSEDGLHAIADGVRHFTLDSATILNRLDAIDTSISNIPQPAGSDTIAAAVWGFPNSGTDMSVYAHLLYLERFAATIGGTAAFSYNGDPFLIVAAQWKYPPD